MESNPVLEFWNALDEPLASLLAQGFTGRTHLLKIARAALGTGEPGFNPLAIDALVTAFAESPLDGVFAGQLLAAPEVAGLLPEDTRTALLAVKEGWREPRSAEYLNRLSLGKDIPRIKRFIERQAASDPENLFWSSKALFLLVDNDPDWVDSLLPNVTEGPLGHALVTAREQVGRFRGDSCDPDSMERAAGNTYGNWSSLHGGLRLASEGHRDEAVLWLLQAFSHAPWNAGLLLRLHDLLGAVDVERSALPGRICVMLYSWNKCDDLDATLASLYGADSDPDLMVLDNGSTDGSDTVLDMWQERFNARREGAFERVTLPVNVGAAAARNWLRHAALRKEYDFLCYLDDDVALPKDWLETLGAAVERYPERRCGAARWWITPTRS
ncbi:glycosyltransferase family 2 protein [Salidesulfovibrio brasiliensis]|uniref:glycosyltransferase family 2 protein n=1 Tax=Salidesulfovibrio brasiliensis TaxID=221711 RepID=UPI0006D1A022|nr:glycosyltransferase [Salidesulfovibrio brasiliensis]